jgi:FkbM family methyltransferase
MKKYLRSVVEHFPHAAAEGFHVFGWRGWYLAACGFLLRRQPFPVTVPGLGKIDSWGEAMNLTDNFSLRELRSDAAEAHLTASREPWIVDVGVNVGLTCRWWLSLSPGAQVVGVDMFQEALDYTTERIAAAGQVSRWHPVCAAVGDREAVVDVRFNDPLEGTSRIDSAAGALSRQMRVRTLDSFVPSSVPARIALLKVDIEGAGGRALAGAPRTLSKCDYVVVETHSDEETQSASRALVSAGLELYRCVGRTMWWRRPGSTP